MFENQISRIVYGFNLLNNGFRIICSSATGKVNQSTHQVVGINGNYPTHITGLTDYTIHMGEKQVVSAKLSKFMWGDWYGMPWRYLDFSLLDSKGNQVWHDTQITNLFTYTATATINTNDISLNPGNYKLIVKYGGDTGINPCKTSSSFVIKD